MFSVGTAQIRSVLQSLISVIVSVPILSVVEYLSDRNLPEPRASRQRCTDGTPSERNRTSASGYQQ